MRGPADDTHKAERFGDTVTADYVFDRHTEDAGLGNHNKALVMLDIATRYLGCEPTESRDTDTTEINLRCFAGDSKVRRFCSYNDRRLLQAT